MRLKFLSALSFSLFMMMNIGCARRNYSNVICAIPRDPSGSLYVTQHAGMALAAARLGMKVYWNGPRGGDDTQQQVELMEHAILQRDAGIVITPTAAFALDTVIQRALSDGIPVVILGPPIPFPPDPHLSFVITDLQESALMAVKRICSNSKSSGDVAIIGIDPVTPGHITLVSSFEKALAHCSSSMHVIVKFGGASTYGQSKMTTTHILLEHPNLTAIYSLNSVGTRGSIAALKELRRNQSVRLISTNPTLDLVLPLRQGAIDSLIFPNMRAMGEKSVENIVAFRKHLSPQPVTFFPPILVTRDNIDTEPIQTLMKMDWRITVP